MSNVVKTRLRDTKPGTGFDSSGSPRQGKVEVTGRIEVTSYAAGESLTPSELGLSAIDFLTLTPEEGMGAADGGERVTAHYSVSAQEFYILIDGASTAGGNNLNLFFQALGDSASDVELL
ncbi:MAG: hypothetical protein ACXABY_32455 [Candidatus Thorarchaeota archaeon]|jgi:hypothetical protein